MVGPTSASHAPSQLSAGAMRSDFASAWEHLLALIDSEPVEAGAPHPADADLGALVAAQCRTGGDRRIAKAFSGIASPSTRAAVLRLLGRLDSLTPRLRRELVVEGLRSESLDVRDAAVQAVESWEDAGCVDLLERHHEAVDWLARYVLDVRRDLGA